MNESAVMRTLQSLRSLLRAGFSTSYVGLLAAQNGLDLADRVGKGAHIISESALEPDRVILFANSLLFREPSGNADLSLRLR